MFKGTLQGFPDWGTLSSGPGLLFLLYLPSPQVPPDTGKSLSLDSYLYYSKIKAPLF